MNHPPIPQKGEKDMGSSRGVKAWMTKDWEAQTEPVNPRVDAARWRQERNKILYLRKERKMTGREISLRMGYKGETAAWNLMRGHSLPRPDAQKRLDDLYEYYQSNGTRGKRHSIQGKGTKKRAKKATRMVHQPQPVQQQNTNGHGNGHGRPSLLQAVARMEQELDTIHTHLSEATNRLQKMREELVA